MSDIRQAALWMKDGKSVRSSERPAGIYAREEDGAFFTDIGGIRTHLYLDDLLAEDWEVA